jgi:hypothetical protein
LTDGVLQPVGQAARAVPAVDRRGRVGQQDAGRGHALRADRQRRGQALDQLVDRGLGGQDRGGPQRD